MKAGAARLWVRGMVGGTLLLLVAGIAVRGIEAERALTPEERGEAPSVSEPMQLLGAGAQLRVAELDALVAEERRGEWVELRRALFELDGCPALVGWLDGPEGQRLERLHGELARGTSEEGLAALVLVFELARATEWSPGFFGRAQHAERLGALLAEWLRTRADASVDDPLLHDPATAATVLYARVMRSAYRAPMVGRNDAAHERARRFFDELCGLPGGRSRFGRALQARFARATGMLAEDGDFLAGFEDEAAVLFPAITGSCDG